MVCRWAQHYPQLIIELMMSISENKTKYPCEILIGRVVEEGLI